MCLGSEKCTSMDGGRRLKISVGQPNVVFTENSDRRHVQFALKLTVAVCSSGFSFGEATPEVVTRGVNLACNIDSRPVISWSPAADSRCGTESIKTWIWAAEEGEKNLIW